MAALHGTHHRWSATCITMGAMDDGPTQLGRVLPLPPAPDGIELRHLRAFVAVAEELNFGRAAARLFLSQPALSRQIRSLERLVGCDLLRRSTHGVELTLSGDALLDRARALLHGVDDAVSSTRAVGGEVAGRLAQIWAPVKGLTAADADLQQLRNATEALHGQFPIPPEVTILSANAGGVPSLRLSADPDLAPTVLYLHGGGFVTGSAFGYRHIAGALAPAGACVVVPEYRLAPEHPFPAALEDAMRAYLWLLDSGARADQVTVVGDSAGAALTMSLLLSLREEGLALPGGAVAMCPGVDFSFERVPNGPGGDTGPDMDIDQLRSFIASYLDGHPIDDPLVSPLKADLTGLPPLLVQGGTGDMIVEDAHRLAEHARAHGVDVRLDLYPADTHDFQVFWSFLPEAADAVESAAAFARQVRGEGRKAASG
jgi:monoterpene epsilon-lactone hydrolase